MKKKAETEEGRKERKKERGEGLWEGWVKDVVSLYVCCGRPSEAMIRPSVDGRTRASVVDWAVGYEKGSVLEFYFHFGMN